MDMKTKTYEEKIKDLEEVVKFYEQGFITSAECITQIMSIQWNPLEMRGIQERLQLSIELNISYIKTLLI